MPRSNLTFSWRWLPLCLAFLTVSTSLGAPRITEFLASNEAGRADEDGEFTDWIEIHNPDAAAVALDGYHLTDNPENPNKWTFPAVTLAPGAYLVVFASGKDRRDPAGELHTDFSLSADGEYLALIAPDETTVLSEFAPSYPPQFEDDSFGLRLVGGNMEWTYFPIPTPGAANGSGTRAGPIFDEAVENPPQPATGPLTITARLRGANDPVTSARLYFRRMYGTEATVQMADNGQGSDAVAGDGIWTATIPASYFAAGEMTRWRFVATDAKGTETKHPSYRSPIDSHQYFGTVAQDPAIRTLLPVFQWFTSSPGGAGTASGSRGSVYYDGEFYDNVLFTVHGQSTSGFPKKSYNIDFNRTQRFRWNPDAPRVADIDLLTNWADKSKVRHVLAYEIMRESGVAAHFAYTVRVEQNGNFFSTADFVEDADEIYLERAGLNPDGALYKVYSNQLNRDAGDNATNGVEKKNRKTENNSDLQALINGLDLTGTALVNYLYDNIDVPACVNMLAANSVIRNIDMHSKNWYIYRDTGRTDEWAILPWDLDLSHGRVWNQEFTYFDNRLYVDGYVTTGTSIRLVAHLFSNSAIRSMILRRIRTLSDRFLQPPPAPGTPESELYYERRLNEQLALIDPPSIVPSDARQDFQKWNSWIQGGATAPYTSSHADVETMAEAILRWKNEYLPGRRNYIYNTQVGTGGGQIPHPQTGAPTFQYTPILSAGAPAKAFVPTDSSLSIFWTGLASREPFNTSSWLSGTTGVGYERGSGYESLIGLNVNSQMQNNSSVYIRVEFDVADPASFERLELRMKYDDGFVAFLNGSVLISANAPVSLQWNSTASGLHEADPAVFEAFDITTKKSLFKPGRNILAIQGLNESTNSSDMIIVPEIHGGKVGTAVTDQPKINFGTIESNPASRIQDQEYIQLLNPNNIAVDISGWRLSGGVEHRFAPGTVLPVGGALYVSPDAAAFRARTVGPRGGQGLFVQGGYDGHLSSLGETINLIDNAGDLNNTVTYQGNPTDEQLHLKVSELMYHPAGNGDAEYIELFNSSSSVTLNLQNVRFTQGIDFNFSDGAITSLPPGGYVLVVRDLAVFTTVYGAGLPVAGVFANDTALSNGGERIKLEDVENGTIFDFEYDDASPWPVEADGAGSSLVLIAPESHPDPALAASWRVSARAGGSPGRDDSGGFSGDPNGDANGNGEPDLIDYALGNDLGLPAAAPAFAWNSADASLRLSYPISLSAENVGVEILFSTDLVNWEDGAPSLEQISREPLGEGRDLVTRRVKAPLSEEPEVFMRLRVTME